MVSICVYTESSKRFLKSLLFGFTTFKFSISLFQILSFALSFSFISPTYHSSSTSDSLSHISVLLSPHLPFNFKLTLFVFTLQPINIATWFRYSIQMRLSYYLLHHFLPSTCFQHPLLCKGHRS